MEDLSQAADAKVNVLFVDDEEMILRAFKRWLFEAPFNIYTVSSADQALEMMKKRSFDVVVSDYRMPGMDGVTFLETVARDHSETFRVLLTAYADLSATVRAVNKANVTHVLHKPVDADELMTVLLGLRYRSMAARRKRELEHRASELEMANAELDRLVKERTGALLDGLLKALEYRDTETLQHSRRVALFTHTMAQRMGVEGDQLLQIQRGALLHDVGKIGVPDAIIRKPGRLSEDEWQVMRTHPDLGYRLLGGMDFLTDARRIVLEHHERFDGLGYPHGIRGRNIYLGARLFSIADTLDAMTSDRPYRGALPFEQAWNEIIDGAERQFDPECVDVFRSIPKMHWSAAVMVGQCCERGEPIPNAVQAVWSQSAFGEAVGAPEPNTWFNHVLNEPEPNNNLTSLDFDEFADSV